MHQRGKYVNIYAKYEPAAITDVAWNTVVTDDNDTAAKLFRLSRSLTQITQKQT